MGLAVGLASVVIHSSGQYIATSGGAYLAGTLAPTYVGAFVAGNTGLVTGLGLVSAAGVAGAVASLTTLGSSAALGLGTALTSVGLGGVATSLGIAPAATTLGLTPVGWAIAGTTATAVLVGGGVYAHIAMDQLNHDRVLDGLEPITLVELVQDIRALEEQSMREILLGLEASRDGISVVDDVVTIHDVEYEISNLGYVIDDDGSESLVTYNYALFSEDVFEVIPPDPSVADEQLGLWERSKAYAGSVWSSTDAPAE